jgi:hypothetical protein
MTGKELAEENKYQRIIELKKQYEKECDHSAVYVIEEVMKILKGGE